MTNGEMSLSSRENHQLSTPHLLTAKMKKMTQLGSTLANGDQGKLQRDRGGEVLSGRRRLMTATAVAALIHRYTRSVNGAILDADSSDQSQHEAGVTTVTVVVPM